MPEMHAKVWHKPVTQWYKHGDKNMQSHLVSVFRAAYSVLVLQTFQCSKQRICAGYKNPTRNESGRPLQSTGAICSLVQSAQLMVRNRTTFLMAAARAGSTIQKGGVAL